MAGTGRCRLYRPDGSAEAARWQREIDAARYDVAATEQMRFYVPVAEGHDDYLMSLALCRHRRARSSGPGP